MEKSKEEILLYLREFSHDPRVASVAPTRPEIVRKICASIAFAEIDVLVEFGPGGGAFTEYLLSKLPRRARLVAFETNHVFVARLRRRIRDPRFKLFEARAEELKPRFAEIGLSKIDSCLSGIPFTMLSPSSRTQIVRDTASVLRPGGKFLIYQALTAPTGMVKLRRELSTDWDLAETKFFWANLPPLYLLVSSPKTIREARYQPSFVDNQNFGAK